MINIYIESSIFNKGRVAFPVFRACGGLLLWHWCWGISGEQTGSACEYCKEDCINTLTFFLSIIVYVWSRYRVNYIYLFDFDPRLVDTPVRIFTNCVNETLVFLVCMLLYYKVSYYKLAVLIL
jgi:hypothetical protein